MVAPITAIRSCSTIWCSAFGDPPPIPKHRRVITIILIRKGGAKHNLLSHGEYAFIAYGISGVQRSRRLETRIKQIARNYIMKTVYLKESPNAKRTVDKNTAVPEAVG